ncbi:hypothetical protein GCM10023149_50620 [Mucilaginibacter gynuensis]|uniref:TraG P-loop domain-containing protein n=1 Tax=Mucilaginibacter gynuensis TaxID=1302236 RepID=A0ABP8HIS9_9SPHI
MAVKNLFNIPYAGIDRHGDYDLLIGLSGEVSVIIRMTNPVIRYSASPAGYEEFHQLFNNIVKLLGDGYLLQKQDIISHADYQPPEAAEYLQQQYNDHFRGRDCLRVETYLVITRRAKKGAFYQYDSGAIMALTRVAEKVCDLLPFSKVLNEAQINHLTVRILSMDFRSPNVSLNNLAPSESEIRMGDRSLRSITLVNIDSIDLPTEVSTHLEMNGKESIRGFPVDLLSFLFKVPGSEVILFNQLIDIPDQTAVLRKLEQKKKRHAGIPDPANQLCVEDIDLLLNDVARESQLLVHAHYNILIAGRHELLPKATNYIESALFGMGIIPSKNAYNQLELFRSALPGNGVELKEYDWFLTTCDAAICFFFKESLQQDEPSDFLLRFTDRQGIPVGMDPADLPMRTGRINNRNKFVLGPSGSGKSFFMNALIEQYMLYEMDMVIVDTGHSYSGLCAYYQGKYITYTDQQPITMNPFQIDESEYNIEKKDFLATLIMLLWKGAEGISTQVERDVISQVISAYYQHYFNPPEFPGLSKIEREAIRTAVAEKLKEISVPEEDTPADPAEFSEVLNDAELAEIDHWLMRGLADSVAREYKFRAFFLRLYALDIRIRKNIAREAFRSKLIKQLDFNSFYEFALWKLPEIKRDEGISFDLDEFRYVLKKFYRGGEYAAILNEAADQSLFTERFIVFEIDSIKEHRVLFPIVTLIIMDVFIQKMRFRSNRRKALVVEEAWKAIASPLMAGYLLYLYKTVRKFWGEAIVVTQELGDIIGNPIVKDSIINNSDTICLLDQTKFRDNYDEIAALLATNETERRKIFTINQLENQDGRGRFKEVYIRRGATGEVYGVEVSLHQYLTYTTEKPEKSAVEKYIKRIGNYRQGLDAFVLDFHASGQSLSAFITSVNQTDHEKFN